jgi:hypothetical protein
VSSKFIRRFKGLQLETLVVGAIRLAAFCATLETALKHKIMKLAGANKSLYTWSGVHFGYRMKDSLFTHHGAQVGNFVGEEVYGPDGVYLGEIKNGRLVTHQAKKSKRWNTFIPQHGKGQREQNRQSEEPMYMGYEEFPHPKTFEMPPVLAIQ